MRTTIISFYLPIIKQEINLINFSKLITLTLSNSQIKNIYG
jgi:hypothetical protein